MHNAQYAAWLIVFLLQGKPELKRRVRTARLSCLLLLCAASLLLSGCDGFGKSAEDRINAAVPVGAEILAAKNSLDSLAKTQSLDAKQIDDDYSARLKVRALECGHGYQPSALADPEKIRAELTDKDCFAKSDQKLKEWLGGRRIGLLLAAPPLRPIPENAPTVIATTEFIQRASFADRAGIVLVQFASKKYQVIDIGNDEVIARGDTDYSPAGNLSPNGRVFLLNIGRDAQVRETETGAVLATFPEVQGYEFHWVNDVGAIFKPGWRPEMEGGRIEGPVFLDFTTGRQTAIPMTGSPGQVIRLPGAEPRFAVLIFTKFGEVKLVRGANGWEAKLISEHPLPTSVSWVTSTSGLTADGKYFFGSGQGFMQLLSLDSLEIHQITLDPLQLQQAIPTADPDRVLLSGYFMSAPGAGVDYGLYSLSQRTMASVDPAQLLSRRVIYIPSLRKNAVIEDAKIVIINKIPAATPIAINDYLQQREQARIAMAHAEAVSNAQVAQSFGTGVSLNAESAQLQAMRTPYSANGARAAMLVKMQSENNIPANVMAGIQRQHGISDAMMASARQANAASRGSTTTYPGAVAELGKNARVEAIGVYEGKGAGTNAGGPRSAGTVQVLVMHSSRPIILSLSSYEPVRWVLSVQPGAKLAAVLTSGYNQSEVLGAGNARVYQMGQQYAYKRGSPEFTALDAEVSHWAGQSIGVFQGTYTGSSFSVGM